MGDYFYDNDGNLLGPSEVVISDLVKQLAAKDKEIKILKKQIEKNKESSAGLLGRLKRGISDAKHKKGRFV